MKWDIQLGQLDVSATIFEICKGLMHLADKSVRRHIALIAAFGLETWVPLPLEDPEAPVVLTFRKWYPRPACGTAFSSVHPILSVCVCVSTAKHGLELEWFQHVSTSFRTFSCANPSLLGWRPSLLGWNRY